MTADEVLRQLQERFGDALTEAGVQGNEVRASVAPRRAGPPAGRSATWASST